MNNYPYNPYGNQGQQYNPYQRKQPSYGNYGVAGDSATHQSLLSKVLIMLSFSLVTAGFGMFAGLQLLNAGVGVFLLPAIILEFVLLIALMITSRTLPRMTMLNLSLLYLFTFMSGLTISTVIASYSAAGALGAVYEPRALTGGPTVGLGRLAWMSRPHLGFLGPTVVTDPFRAAADEPF